MISLLVIASEINTAKQPLSARFGYTINLECQFPCYQQLFIQEVEGGLLPRKSISIRYRKYFPADLHSIRTILVLLSRIPHFPTGGYVIHVNARRAFILRQARNFIEPVTFLLTFHLHPAGSEPRMKDFTLNGALAINHFIPSPSSNVIRHRQNYPRRIKTYPESNGIHRPYPNLAIYLFPIRRFGVLRVC